MRYCKLALFLLLLGFTASAVANMHGGHFGGGGHMVGGHMGGGAPHAQAGGEHFRSEPHGAGAHHFDGEHHHRHAFIAGFVGAPLLYWPPYESIAPYSSYSLPTPYVSQDQPNPVWYYCDEPPGYFPYITECASGWRTILADPAALP